MPSAANLPALKPILVDIKLGLEDWNYPDCAAPFWRLYWNAAGRGIVGYRGKRYALEGRHVLLIPPETAFSARAEGPMDHLYLHFLAGPPYDGVGPCVLSSAASAGELDSLRRLAALVRSASAGKSGDEERRAAGLYAASLIYGRLAALPAALLPAPASGELPARVAELLRASLAAPPSNAAIAAELGMSVPTLERAMRAQAGLSLHAYGLQLRINEACIMLRHSADSIDEIAEALGFSDRSHFSRTFARLRGESPGEYRRSSP